MEENHLLPAFKMRRLFLEETDPKRRKCLGLSLLLKNTMSEVLFVLENSPGEFLKKRALNRYGKLLKKQENHPKWN
ncbi:MAG: hypothetical protein V1851_01460 [Patescibacteria group bacterium]